jgi:NAD(P)-dependent dehydrogenase (short-subunit alcohol dehydrogenase family)
MDISGKVALLTGAARIGSTVAEALAARGARVALVYRNSESAAGATVKDIAKAGGEAEAFRADLSDPGAAQRLVQAVVKRFGRLDILVNMASSYRAVAWEDQDAAAWDSALAADARGAYLLALAASAPMRESGGGRIVNFSDWTAVSGRPRYKGYLGYYTAKRAVQGLTEALALELAPEILVNAIAPGPILPPPDLSAEEIAAVERATPLGRWGGADEIAKAVVFLTETDFITGECIRVDGGRHLA